MKYKIGVYGSAEDMSEGQVEKARKLGRALSKYKDNIIVITGACSGIPYEVSYEAYKGGVEIWGFSPAVDFESQKKLFPGDDVKIYKKLFYVPADFIFSNNQLVSRKYRNVTSTATVDGAIIIAGRWGTLNEFTNLVDYGKVIGVLTDTGGISDLLTDLVSKIKKEGAGKVIFNSSPEVLVGELLSSLKNPS